MEAAALFALAGLGYVLTRMTSDEPKEGFQNNAQRGPADNPLQQAERGASVSGPSQNLDLQYGQGIPPSSPSPGIRGSLLT